MHKRRNQGQICLHFYTVATRSWKPHRLALGLVLKYIIDTHLKECAHRLQLNRWERAMRSQRAVARAGMCANTGCHGLSVGHLDVVKQGLKDQGPNGSLSVCTL